MTDSEVEAPAVRDGVRLVVAAQAGDQDALATLLASYLPTIYNIIGRALQGHADVDDVVQETMFKVIRGLPSLREPDKFRSWLIAIGHRQVQIYLRDRRRLQQRRQEIPDDQPDMTTDFAERTVTEILLAAQRRELTEAARWLDDDDRRLLSLWWRETLGDLTRSDVAENLGVPPKRAGMRMLRMRAQLEAVRGVVRALQATPRCAQLEGVTRGWNGNPSSVWRKRLTRHVRDCPRCSGYERGLIPPERLLLGILALPVSAPARTGHLTWSVLQNLLSNKVLAGTAAITIAAGGGFAYAVHETPATDRGAPAIAGPAAAAPAPGRAGRTGPTTASRPSAPSVTGAPGITEADIFVAPDGDDAGTGAADRPFATLAKAVAAVQPGQTIALRGGTYQPTTTVVITTGGTAQKRITLGNYEGERPVIDASRIPAGADAITQRAAYWTVQGLEIKNSGGHAYVCHGCQHDVFRRLSIHDNTRSGLTFVDDGTIGNQILDSDFFGNYDPAEHGRAGLGLGFRGGSGEGNVVRGNRAFANADNGFDLSYFESPVTLEHNWAYGNGFNRWNVEGWQSNADGFHIGGGNPPPNAAHVLRDNAAWDNVGSGFSTSGNRGAVRLTHNTAFRNGYDGFSVYDALGGVFDDNAAGGNGKSPAVLNPDAVADGNLLQRGSDTATPFRGTDPTAAEGARAADGRLPKVIFLATDSGAGARLSAAY